MARLSGRQQIAPINTRAHTIQSLQSLQTAVPDESTIVVLATTMVNLFALTDPLI